MKQQKIENKPPKLARIMKRQLRTIFLALALTAVYIWYFLPLKSYKKQPMYSGQELRRRKRVENNINKANLQNHVTRLPANCTNTQCKLPAKKNCLQQQLQPTAIITVLVSLVSHDSNINNKKTP